MSEFGKLGPEDALKAFSKLKDRGAQIESCRLCGSSEMMASETLVKLQPLASTLFGEKKVFPFVLMMCRNCGNASLMNAVMLGIVGPAAEEEEATEAAANGPK
jgi:hypothetical protein